MTTGPEQQPKLTPMLKQYLEVKKAHPDKLILFRMGDFYETFFEDAYTTSKTLNITLTTRNKNDENAIPLAGFPYHALDNYLEKLIKAGLKVAICEQMEDPKQAVGLVKREITQIITPGAILDQNLIDQTSHNYLTAIYYEDPNRKQGLASLDLSTGDFMFTELLLEELPNELSRLQPAEIVVASVAAEQYIQRLALEFEPAITIFDSWQFQPSEAASLLKKHFGVRTLEGFGAHNKAMGATAAGAALAYIQSLYKDPLSHIVSLKYYSISSFMQLDEISRRNLELTRSIRYGSRHGSLISVIDQTMTPMGSRLLNHWLLHPLLDAGEILQRQSVISRFLANTAYLKDLRARLKDIGDLSRLVSRIAALRVNPRELNSLRSYLLVCAEIVECLAKFPGEAFLPWMNHLKGYEDICELVDRAILENPPHTITEGGIFKKGYNADLDEFKDIIYDGKSMIARLEEEEKRKTGIPSLKIGYNKVFGYYIEVTSTHKHRVPEYYTAKQTLVNSERYISPRLKEFEAKVLSAEERIKNLEYELYRELRNSVSSHLNRLIELSDILSLIDVFSSLAFLAWQNNYTAPQILEERELEIVEGRHPVIEKLLTEDEFIPNDTVLNYDQTRIAIITGPNMAGKSTYLRQIGLLVILAQIGSYVPAKRMKLPIFDRVFTRVGASDNLAQGQSTFLVEMIETANILHSATPNSLILLDEIGRGTSTFDGLSLAWAIIEHIEKHNHSLTLFATHYHELTELENIYPAIWNYNVAVKQWNDQIIFLRKIERGGADQSYGIQVARLAGIPHKVIIRAKDILRNLEEHEISPQGLTATIRKKLNKNVPQIEIFELMMDKTDDKDNLLQEIKEINLDETSPAQALQILYDLQKKLSE